MTIDLASSPENQEFARYERVELEALAEQVWEVRRPIYRKLASHLRHIRHQDLKTNVMSYQWGFGRLEHRANVVNLRWSICDGALDLARLHALIGPLVVTFISHRK